LRRLWSPSHNVRGSEPGGGEKSAARQIDNLDGVKLRPGREATGRRMPLMGRSLDGGLDFVARHRVDPRHLAGRRSMIDLSHGGRRDWPAWPARPQIVLASREKPNRAEAPEQRARQEPQRPQGRTWRLPRFSASAAKATYNGLAVSMWWPLRSGGRSAR
jgi:hypothetical protein